MKCAGHVGCTMRLRWTRRSDTQKRRNSLSCDHLMKTAALQQHKTTIPVQALVHAATSLRSVQITAWPGSASIIVRLHEWMLKMHANKIGKIKRQQQQQQHIRLTSAEKKKIRGKQEKPRAKCGNLSLPLRQRRWNSQGILYELCTSCIIILIIYIRQQTPTHLLKTIMGDFGVDNL